MESLSGPCCSEKLRTRDDLANDINATCDKDTRPSTEPTSMAKSHVEARRETSGDFQLTIGMSHFSSPVKSSRILPSAEVGNVTRVSSLDPVAVFWLDALYPGVELANPCRVRTAFNRIGVLSIDGRIRVPLRTNGASTTFQRSNLRRHVGFSLAAARQTLPSQPFRGIPQRCADRMRPVLPGVPECLRAASCRHVLAPDPQP